MTAFPAGCSIFAGWPNDGAVIPEASAAAKIISKRVLNITKSIQGSRTMAHRTWRFLRHCSYKAKLGAVKLDSALAGVDARAARAKSDPNVQRCKRVII
jgi:hypothetical protein